MSEIKQEKVIKVAKQSRISLMLDKYFHFTERNSTAGREVKAGLSVFFISVCALFMNIQIVMEAFEKDVPYCGLYLGAVITAFIGTLLLGVVCNLPLVQTASLSLSSEDRDKVPVTAADILGVFIETKIPYVLSCKSQFCSKQTDGPGDLQPQQEHR